MFNKKIYIFSFVAIVHFMISPEPKFDVINIVLLILLSQVLTNMLNHAISVSQYAPVPSQKVVVGSLI